MSDVVIARRDTDLAPFTGPSGGSRIIYSQGKAVQMAAADARDKLIALAAEHLDVQPGMLTCANGRVFVTETPERGYTLGQLARLSLTSASGRLWARPRPCPCAHLQHAGSGSQRGQRDGQGARGAFRAGPGCRCSH